ncbi:hypothetical protein JL721_9492 [Aureococcus anophagefferens]|nr:hypothetical protein JL721_9492 [Aureococcus anophagefferens]
MFALRAAARTVAHKRPFFSLAYSALQEEAQKLPYQLTAPPPALRCVTSTKSGADARLLGEELGRDLVDRLGGAARVAVVVVASRAVGDVVVAAATAAELPEARRPSVRVEADGLPDFDAARPGAWEAYATGPAPELLLLAAAPRGDLGAWLRRMVAPGSTKLGGVLEDESGELVAGDAFAAERVREGVCGIALEGVRLDAAVAAGPTLATLRGPRTVTSARPVDGGVAITGLDGDEETCCARSLGAGDSAGDLEGLLVKPGCTKVALAGDRDRRERALLAAFAPRRRAFAEKGATTLEFAGTPVPSEVAAALGSHSLGATFHAAIAPDPAAGGTVVHTQATVVAYLSTDDDE